MGFRIITDSASDIPQETARAWDITVLPIHTRFGEEEYLDGVTLQPRQFFEKLIETGEIPRTSQITPFEYSREFRKSLEKGEGVLCITISSGVSGTYQSACAAARDCNEGLPSAPPAAAPLSDDRGMPRVVVIDSRQFCISLYALVQYACRCRDLGMDLGQTAAAVEAAKERVHVISVFATLEYLKLGGRISRAAALAGGLLSIKPVITITDGVVDVIGRARGSKKANNMLQDFIRRVGGIDFDMPYCLGYTGFSDEALRKYIEDNGALYEKAASEVPIIPVGATVGTYAGPGAVAFAFFHKEAGTSHSEDWPVQGA